MSLLHILLAEDNPGDVLLVQESLGAHHIEHQLHVVSDGEQALTFVARMGEPGASPCPDIFLLDLNLPKADGPTVLKEFRKRHDCARTPVIIVTSSDRPKERAQVTALGISHYFHKPSNLVEFMELGAVVKAVVEAKQS
jgi:chemotaxis family two-component system response regulator Rcp1